ncbi:MAG: glycosyltransferase family 2 protein [Acidobacteriota bacterium]
MPQSSSTASAALAPRELVPGETPEPQKELTVVIPAFNEEGAIADVVRGVLDQLGDLVAEVVVVDDGSRDATAQLASEAGARVISKRRNRGYGAALKTGIRACRTPYFITMDADGQHRAQDARALWARAKDNHMVIGSRQGLIHSVWWRMPGKWLLNLIAQILVQQRIPDLNSGLRILHRDTALKYLHICPSGFSMSTTTTMAFLTRGYDVEFVPIRVERRIGTSTVKLKTGWDTLILILRIATLFNPLRLFLPLSFLATVSGVAWGLPIVIAREGVSVGAMLAIVTGLLLFFLGLISDQISQLRLERFEEAEPRGSSESATVEASAKASRPGTIQLRE